MKLLIADDHAIFRRGLKEILTEAFPDLECGEAENGQQVLEQVSKNDWDLVILDITMPGQSGLDILKELSAIRAELPVLVLSVHTEEQYAARVLKAGARGFVNKMKAPHELVAAVRQVVAGGTYVSPTLAERLASQPKTGAVLPHETLTDREYQVMQMILQGKSTKEMGADLSLSPQAVSTYRSRLLKKMGMQTNAEIMRYALENRLVD